MVKSVILLLGVVGLAFAQVILKGDCPEVNVVHDVDQAATLGTWYEWGRYENIFELDTKCNYASYSLNSNGTIDVLNRAINEITGITEEMKGTAYADGNSTDGKFYVYFPTIKAESTVYIVDTDYSNAFALFACRKLGDQYHERFAWLLTREKVPSDEVVNKTKAAFDAQNISSDDLNVINQQNCVI